VKSREEKFYNTMDNQKIHDAKTIGELIDLINSYAQHAQDEEEEQSLDQIGAMLDKKKQPFAGIDDEKKWTPRNPGKGKGKGKKGGDPPKKDKLAG